MKACIISSGFQHSTTRLQPWRYIYEISKNLKKENIEIEIISDGNQVSPKVDKIDGIRVNRLRRFESLHLFGGKKLVNLIKERNPDII